MTSKEMFEKLDMNKEIKIITLEDIFDNIESEEKAFKFIDYINNLQKKCENAVADYELEKYKNIKALSWTNRIIEIIKQQPTEDDIWILENLHTIKYLLQGSDKKMEYFKLNKEKREIIIDKYKKYNVNIDILDLIIDLKCENDRLNNIINECSDDILKELKENHLSYGVALSIRNKLLDYKELKEE